MVLVVLLGFVPSASAGTDLFVYPTAPDSITHLQRRCDYIVSRFWDRCNFEVAMLHKDKFNTAFGDWVNIMPHASADTVYNSITRLMNRFPKNPDVALQLGQMAEEWVYSDTSQIYSEDIFLPFAQAVRDHKKIGKADKARFARNAKIIESSRVGAKLPDIEFIRPDGTRGNLGEIKSGSVLLFFNHPDCSDCNMARTEYPQSFQLISARTPCGPSLIHISGMPRRSTPGDENLPCAWQSATFSSRVMRERASSTRCSMGACLSR